MVANTTKLTKAQQDVLLALIAEHGCVRAAHFVGVSPPTLRSAAHGLTVQRSTAVALAQQIEARGKGKEGT